jgi:hypothetical protein
MTKGERTDGKGLAKGHDKEPKTEKVRNKVFLWTDSDGVEQPVRISEEYLAVHPTDGNEAGSFIVPKADLKPEGCL